MKKQFLIIGIIIIMLLFLVGCTEHGIPGSRVLEKQFYAGEQVAITFPEWAIDVCDSNSVEDVFVSITDQLIWVFYLDETGAESWWYSDWDESFNTLKTIEPDKEYVVLVNQDCTLTIQE